MAKKKPEVQIPEGKLKLYDKLVAAFPEVERKGASMPYTSVNGNMFSFLNPEGELALRLPADEREAFLVKYKTKLFTAHGTVMKEYVHVPAALLSKTTELKKHFAVSLAYAASLKKKATKK